MCEYSHYFFLRFFSLIDDYRVLSRVKDSLSLRCHLPCISFKSPALLPHSPKMAATAHSTVSSHVVFKAENRGLPPIREERVFPEASRHLFDQHWASRFSLSYKGWENKHII